MKYVEYLGWLVVALKPISFFSDLENWKLRKLPATLNWQVGNFTLQTRVFASTYSEWFKQILQIENHCCRLQRLLSKLCLWLYIYRQSSYLRSSYHFVRKFTPLIFYWSHTSFPKHRKSTKITFVGIMIIAKQLTNDLVFWMND